MSVKFTTFPHALHTLVSHDTLMGVTVWYLMTVYNSLVAGSKPRGTYFSLTYCYNLYIYCLWTKWSALVTMHFWPDSHGVQA